MAKKPVFVVPTEKQIAEMGSEERAWYDDSLLILGAMISGSENDVTISPTSIVVDELYPEDSRLAIVHHALMSLWEDSQSINVNAVKTIIERSEVPVDASFVSKLYEMAHERGLHQPGNGYMVRVLRLSKENAWIYQLGVELLNKAKMPGKTAREKLAEITFHLAKSQNEIALDGVPWLRLEDAINDFLEDAASRKKRRETGEKPIGFPEEWGSTLAAYEFEDNEMIVVSSPSGHGKTIAALQTALYNAKNGYVVVYVPLETNVMNLVRRWLAMLFGIPMPALKKGVLSSETGIEGLAPEYKEKLRIALDQLSRGGLYIVPFYNATGTQLAATIAKASAIARSRNRRCLVIIDYLGAANWAVGSFVRSEREGLVGVVNQIKGATDQTGCVTLLFSQANTEGGTLGSMEAHRRGQIILNMEYRKEATYTLPYAQLSRESKGYVYYWRWHTAKGMIVLTSEQCIQHKIMPGTVARFENYEGLPVLLQREGKTSGIGTIRQQKANEEEPDLVHDIAVIGQEFRIEGWSEDKTLLLTKELIRIGKAINKRDRNLEAWYADNKPENFYDHDGGI